MKNIKTSMPEKSKSLIFKIFIILLFIVILSASFGMTIINSYSNDIPSTNKLQYFNPTQATILYSADGKIIGRIFQENRTWISLNDIPDVMKNAIFAIEDSRFYRHHGIDLIGIFRAFVADVRHQKTKQGASTITQQLARNIFLTPEVSFQRKIKEIILALKIEKQFSKNEILEFYLNQIYFGAGAYGINSAANIYFGKDVKSLTLAQCAILAGLPAAPSVYSPLVNFSLAKERQYQVLQRMVQLKFISKQEADAAYNEKINFAKTSPEEFHNLSYPYFTTYTVRELFNAFSNDLIFRGGLKVYTTMDEKMQELAQKDLVWGVKKGLSEGINCHEGALVTVEPQTGFIRAMIGGTGFKVTDQFNRAWQARRQPGSAFKVFVYTAAIDMGYTPKTIVYDSPVTYTLSDGQVYSPVNCDKKYWGAMPVEKAIQFSRNVAAIRVAHDIGIDRVIEYAYKMGIKESLEPHLSLALGSAVVTPLQMASAFSVLPNEGIRVEPTSIIKVLDANDNVLLDNTHPYQQEVIPADTAYTMVKMMEQVILAGTATTANIGRPAAGKTGTTNDFRDAWFIGFTPDLCTAVWVGNDNYDKMIYSYGGYIPATIWGKYMKQVLKDKPKLAFKKPEISSKAIIVCKDTRQRAAPNCPHTDKVYLSMDEALKLPLCKKHMPAQKFVKPAAKKQKEDAAKKENTSLEDLPFNKEVITDKEIKETPILPDTENKVENSPAPENKEE